MAEKAGGNLTPAGHADLLLNVKKQGPQVNTEMATSGKND